MNRRSAGKSWWVLRGTLLWLGYRADESEVQVYKQAVIEHLGLRDVGVVVEYYITHEAFNVSLEL